VRRFRDPLSRNDDFLYLCAIRKCPLNGFGKPSLIRLTLTLLFGSSALVDSLGLFISLAYFRKADYAGPINVTSKTGVETFTHLVKYWKEASNA